MELPPECVTPAKFSPVQALVPPPVSDKTHSSELALSFAYQPDYIAKPFNMGN